MLKTNFLSHQNANRLLDITAKGSAATAAVILGLIVVFVIHEAWPALQELGLGHFILDPNWYPANAKGTATFGVLPILFGSILCGFGAVLIAAPISIASAIYSTLYEPKWIQGLQRKLLQVLNSIPSVVIGFWGLMVLTPLIREWHPPGQSLLAGALCLVLMILPTTALLSEQAFLSVPGSQLEAATLLGLSPRATLQGVIWPNAKGHIWSAMLLACGRALGETMAVLMVAGNVIQFPSSLFDPVRTLTANIALELGYAVNLHRSALFVGGLLLMTMVGIIMAMAPSLEVKSRDA